MEAVDDHGKDHIAALYVALRSLPGEARRQALCQPL
jgi:hypothetical protein